jgi:hypothetical protein
MVRTRAKATWRRVVRSRLGYALPPSGLCASLTTFAGRLPRGNIVQAPGRTLAGASGSDRGPDPRWRFGLGLPGSDCGVGLLSFGPDCDRSGSALPRLAAGFSL